MREQSSGGAAAASPVSSVSTPSRFRSPIPVISTAHHAAHNQFSQAQPQPCHAVGAMLVLLALAPCTGTGWRGAHRGCISRAARGPRFPVTPRPMCDNEVGGRRASQTFLQTSRGGRLRFEHGTAMLQKKGPRAAGGFLHFRRTANWAKKLIPFDTVVRPACMAGDKLQRYCAMVCVGTEGGAEAGGRREEGGGRG